MNKSGVKTKTSITLSLPLLVKIDQVIGKGASRSAFIERVLDDRLRQMEWDEIQERDRKLINSAAGRLNAEAADVLEDQDNAYMNLVGEPNGDPGDGAME